MKKNLKHFPVYISIFLSQHSDFLILAFLFYSLEFAKRMSYYYYYYYYYHYYYYYYYYYLRNSPV